MSESEREKQLFNIFCSSIVELFFCKLCLFILYQHFLCASVFTEEISALSKQVLEFSGFGSNLLKGHPQQSTVINMSKIFLFLKFDCRSLIIASKKQVIMFFLKDRRTAEVKIRSEQT